MTSPESPGSRVLPSATRIIAFSSIAGAMTTFGQTSGVSVFVNPLIEDLALSRAEVATFYSIGSLAAAVAMPWIGSRIDRHGIRRSTIVVAALFGGAIILLSQVGGPLWLLLGFLLIRMLGQGALNLISKVAVAIRFRTSLGRAVGISGAMAAVGLSVLPVISSAGIELVGWRETLILGGLSVWLVVIPLTLWALPPAADRALTERSQAVSTEPSTDRTRGQAVRSGMFWLVALGVATNAFASTGLSFHQIAILGEAGLSPTAAAAVFVPQNIAAVTALALVGTLSDRLPGKVLIVVSMALMALSTGMVAVLGVPGVPILYGIAIGTSVGIGFAAEGVLFVRYFGVKAIASIRGLAFTATVAAAAAGPILVGVVRGMSADYVPAALLLGIVPIAIIVAAPFVKTPARIVGERGASA